MTEARYYKAEEGDNLRCLLCPHRCIISEGESGLCNVRRNQSGRLIADSYMKAVTSAVDPVEKKPLYHFRPGSSVFSTGPNGCNFRCAFCQNSDIAQGIAPVKKIDPESVVEAAVNKGCRGIAYTYSEPIIWFETVMELGRAAKNRGLDNIIVSNGYIETEPLEELLRVVDAFNIDIKSLESDFYKKLCRAKPGPVLKTCEQIVGRAHLEITNLIIPEENDSEEDFDRLADYIYTNLGRNTPLHLSRYFPANSMTTPPTPKETMERAVKTVRRKLNYVYAGNISIANGVDTVCPECGAVLIKRFSYNTEITKNINTQEPVRCEVCGMEIPVMF